MLRLPSFETGINIRGVPPDFVVPGWRASIRNDMHRRSLQRGTFPDARATDGVQAKLRGWDNAVAKPLDTSQLTGGFGRSKFIVPFIIPF